MDQYADLNPRIRVSSLVSASVCAGSAILFGTRYESPTW